MDRFAAMRAWVRSENVARFRRALSGALPADQRRIIEELLAAELRNSASAAACSQAGDQWETDADGAPSRIASIPRRIEHQ